MSHQPRTPNRLARETSPYLLQHAKNPVDWYPWGEEAFARAKAEDKPMLLSIGYSACHWCHVMARESFENDEIAGLMNEHFVCVKVDREERPDVDGLYMTATIALSGSGGWPMTVFLTPDREPFFAGTYFPPDERGGRPGFRALLRRVAELWKENRSSLLQQASELTAAIRTTSPHSGDGPVGQTALERAIERLSLSFDERFGGFGSAPKFPPHGALTVLLSHVHRTQDPRAEFMLRRTLDAMASGGIHDHLGGGFARYSTDAEWLVPHFEKMLCDNAQLGRIYAEASVVLGEPRYEVVARKTIDYVLRELLDPRGGFYSATDADSEGEEGKYFVWSQDELVDALGPESATHFSAYYGALAQGNWEGKNVLHTARSLEDVAADLEVPPDELEETLACARQVLLEVRGERVPPAIDDQVITAHNALMISTLAEASRLFGESRYREAAERAARFILRELRRSDGGLLRTWHAGAAKTPGFLDDHAYLADALIDLYEAGGDREHLATARELAMRLLNEFSDSEAGDYYTTTTEHEGLLFRDKAPHDGALPHATAIAARAVIRLSRYFDDPALLAHGHRALRSQADLLEQSPHAALTVLRTLDLALDAPIELVLVGAPESLQYQALARALGRAYLPSRVLVHYDPRRPETAAELPIVNGKTLVAGEAALYVCGHGTCHATVTAPEGVAGAIQTAKAFGSQFRGVSLGAPRLEGSATSQGTERFMQQHAATLPPAAFVELGTGLRVSRLGIAARRAHGTAAQQRRRLEAALSAGMNLIDVTAGSAMEETELLVGEALAEACARGTCHREEIVILSKVGPIRGRALALLRKRRASGKTAIRSLRVDDSLEYSVEPQWLEQHLTRVLERMGLDCLDAYLVDTPELLLTAPEGASSGTETEAALYASLEAAFRHLEGEVIRGRIRFYGISTGAWHSEAPASERFRLGPILDAALAAGGANHRFRIIEVPLNLVEQGVLAPRSHERDRRSIAAEATARGVSVLTARPLSAQWEGATLPLREAPQAPETAAPEALEALEAAEHGFAAKFAPLLRVTSGAKPARALFDFRKTLERTRDEARSPEEFEAAYLQRVAPAVAASVRAVDAAYRGADSHPWQNWRDAYLATLAKAVGALRHLAGAGSQAVVETLASILGDATQSPPEDTSLANRLLWLTCHAPNVTSTVVEWGSEAELDEGTRVLRWPAPARASEGFDAVRRDAGRLRTVWREATGAPGGRGSTD